MPFDDGLRLNDRQRIANARKKPIEANKNQAVDEAEGLFLRSGSPQNVYLLPQRQNFRLERCPRPKQIYDRPNNEPDKISHPTTASPDSRSTASQIEFATGTTVNRERIVAQAARYQIATVYPGTLFVQAGGLLSYGVDVTDLFRRAASYVDRILKGEKPANLPVQAPAKFELAINLKTAKALGLAVPPSMLTRADEVIE
jgi:hypothetical protein